MTKPLNAEGTGRGLKIVTRPITKKRGARTTKEGKAKDIAQARGGTSMTNRTTAELATVENFVLTDKAKQFVKFWAQGESIATASARAGYGDGASYAYRIVHIPAVIALYEEEKRLYAEAAQMDRKKVMDMHLEAYEMAKLMAEPATMVSAAREIGKMCGFYEPVQKKLDITINGKTLAKRLDAMSDEDLMNMVAQGVSAMAQLETDGDDE